MKKIIGISFVILVIVAIGLYFYTYKDHRDIASEEVSFSISTKALQDEFNENDSLFNLKYADKTIEIYGKTSDVDVSNHTIIIDGKVEVVLVDTIMKNIELSKDVKIKGRYVGYDDLLEEFKFDQAVIVDYTKLLF